MSAPHSATMFPGCFVRAPGRPRNRQALPPFPLRPPESPGAAMAKKKASKGKSAKMPKKIGGTKVPKEVRSAGDMLASLVTSPMARELVADALIAVAGVLAGNKKTREAVAGAGAEAASGAKEISARPRPAPSPKSSPAPPAASCPRRCRARTTTGRANAPERMPPSRATAARSARTRRTSAATTDIPTAPVEKPAPRRRSRGPAASGRRKHSPSRRKNVAPRRARC